MMTTPKEPKDEKPDQTDRPAESAEAPDQEATPRLREAAKFVSSLVAAAVGAAVNKQTTGRQYIRARPVVSTRILHRRLAPFGHSESAAKVAPHKPVNTHAVLVGKVQKRIIVFRCRSRFVRRQISLMGDR
jgi:hypothetical protein